MTGEAQSQQGLAASAKTTLAKGGSEYVFLDLTRVKSPQEYRQYNQKLIIAAGTGPGFPAT
jgi:hypothetical protein